MCLNNYHSSRSKTNGIKQNRNKKKKVCICLWIIINCHKGNNETETNRCWRRPTNPTQRINTCANFARGQKNHSNLENFLHRWKTPARRYVPMFNSWSTPKSCFLAGCISISERPIRCYTGTTNFRTDVIRQWTKEVERQGLTSNPETTF